MNKILLKNGWFCKIVNNNISPFYGSIEIIDGKISNVFDETHEIIIDPETEIFDIHGKFVTIPLTNFHEHIYSKLAKGLKIKSALSNFNEILSDYWWQVDLQLDEEMTHFSALLTGIDSIKNGVGYIFDHHSSPNYILGSLKTISKALESLSIKNVLCYELTDRNGTSCSKDAIFENIDNITSRQTDKSKGLFGMHASFTISDNTLTEVSQKLKNLNTGIHIHICEDKADRNESLDRFNKTPLNRLIENNLLNEKSILAHGVHLTKDEISQIKEIGANLVINPDSNLNNAVGLIDFNEVKENKVLLGTDGMHSNMLRSMKNVFLLSRHCGMSFSESFDFIKNINKNQLTYLSKFFPKFNKMDIGDNADFVVWDYTPPTDVNDGNIWGHIIYGLTESNATDFIMNGEFILKDKKLTKFNEEEVLVKAKEKGDRLYSLIESLKGDK